MVPELITLITLVTVREPLLTDNSGTPVRHFVQNTYIPKIHKNGQKHKKLFFLAPERARTVLNAFLECMHLALLAGACK